MLLTSLLLGLPPRGPGCSGHPKSPWAADIWVQFWRPRQPWGTPRAGSSGKSSRTLSVQDSLGWRGASDSLCLASGGTWWVSFLFKMLSDIHRVQAQLVLGAGVL